MPLYPDLAACGIDYIHLSVHLSGGIGKVDDFWETKGVSRSARRTLFATYTRQGRPHAAWLQWTRSDDSCCDIYVGLEARPPSDIWPDLPRETHRLRERDLREFLEYITKLEDLRRARVRYGFPSSKGLDGLLPPSPTVRATNLTIEVLDEDQKPAMHVTYQRTGDAWSTMIAPTARLAIKGRPVTAAFFKEPYEAACLLAETFRRVEQQP